MATLINDPIIVLPSMHEELTYRWDSKLAKESPESLPEWLKPFFGEELIMKIESPCAWSIHRVEKDKVYTIVNVRLSLLSGTRLASQLQDGELIRLRDDNSVVILR